VVGHPDRLKDVAKDIVDHFEARQKVFEGKAMIVGMTRNICNPVNHISRTMTNFSSSFVSFIRVAKSFLCCFVVWWG
jgi:type I site-specific restriction-modification system R (restriction) subunit